MAAFRYDLIRKYVIKVVCDGPLRIGNSFGDEEGILVNTITGDPFIQATSLNGVLRAFCEKEFGNSCTNELFGAASEAYKGKTGRLKIMDAEFDPSTLKIELRPHVEINKETETVANSNLSGQKYELEYVGTGSEAFMYLYLYEDSTNPIADQLEHIISALQKGILLFGAKKSNGAGKLRLIDAKYKLYDMRTAEGRRAWSEEDSEENYEVLILNPLQHQVMGAYYELSISGKTEGPIQVRGIAVNEFGVDAADSINIRNSKNEYIVPGSSFKGTIRNQMEKIAAYVGNEKVIAKSFGKMEEIHAESCAGNLIFADAVIGTIEDNDKIENRNRIHIDKFTGGVFHGGKFTEKNACGTINFKIIIKDNCKEQEAQASLGGLLLALRDLACGIVSVGNGYATGKGIILVDDITIKSKESQAVITFDEGKMKIEGQRSIVEDAIKALQQGA